MFSYKGLGQKLNEQNIMRSDLTKLLGLSSRTVAKIAKGEKLSRGVMEKLTAFFWVYSGRNVQGNFRQPYSANAKGIKKRRKFPEGFITSCRCV